MSTPQAWHIESGIMRRWVDGTASPLVSLSVEQHLQRCGDCRAEFATFTPTGEHEAIWDKVLAELEVGPVSRREQLLCRLGVRPADAQLILGALSLHAAWLCGVLAVLAFSVVAAMLGTSSGVPLFLMAAPLVPVIGVAAAYGPNVDPSYELGLAAPYSMTRLVLLRTAAVVATSVPVVVAAGLLLPTSAVVAIAWLLPALGFVILVLIAGNWFGPEIAAAVIAVAWIVEVGWAARQGDPTAVFDSALLAAYLAIAVVAGLVLVHRLRSPGPAWRLR
jgi:hypothetical protein